MGTKKSVKDESEDSFQESIRGQRINKLREGIIDLLDSCNLSAIEILGVLEYVRQTVHDNCICNECAKKRDL